MAAQKKDPIHMNEIFLHLSINPIYIIALTLSFMPQAVSQHLQALHREQISLLPAASPPV